MSTQEFAGQKKRIVILGGGFGGAYCAQTLCRKLDLSTHEVILIDRNNFMLFYPLLVEAGVGMLEARHVVAPIRRFMPNGDYRMAEVTGVDAEAQQVRYRVVGQDDEEFLHYDHLVFALGSITKAPPIPGLAEYAFQLKSLVDAIAMRDRGIRLLEVANTIEDPDERQALLTVVTVGANFTGVEFAGEYFTFLKRASRAYKNIGADEVKMVIIEHAPRILQATSENLSAWCHRTLEERGVEIHTKTGLVEVGEDYCVSSSGLRIKTRTVLWAAGIEPHPMVRQIPTLPANERGYVRCEDTLQVRGFTNVWAVGDSAEVLDPNGKQYAATAQNASRQGPLCAKNIMASLRGEGQNHFRFSPVGSFAAIGHRQAAASVMGRDLTGFLGWFLYRTVYLMKMPTLASKSRLMADWTVDLFFPYDPVQLGVHRIEHGPVARIAAPQPVEFGHHRTEAEHKDVLSVSP